MTGPLRRTVLVVTWLACALVAAGCGDDEPATGEGTAWPRTDTPVATDGLVWAAGDEVHLADGSRIELDQEVGSYVVAGPGVFYFSDDSDGPPFLLATPDGEVVETDADPYGPSLRTSVDGRWLGFIDQPQGEDGPREVVVVDLTTGEEVVRSRTGVVPEDDTSDLDWQDLYEDAPVDVVGIVEDTAYVVGLGDYYAWDLLTGDAEVVDDIMRPVDQPPYWNPSRTWQVPLQDVGAVPVLQPASGEAVTTSFPEPDPSAPPPLPGDPDLESWTLTGWLDDETAVGLTSTTDARPVPVLVTCAVPSGRCEVVPGAEGGVSLPVDRPSGLPPVYP